MAAPPCILCCSEAVTKGWGEVTFYHLKTNKYSCCQAGRCLREGTGVGTGGGAERAAAPPTLRAGGGSSPNFG